MIRNGMMLVGYVIGLSIALSDGGSYALSIIAAVAVAFLMYLMWQD